MSMTNTTKKNIFKSALAALLAATMIAGAMAGCGGDKSSKAEVSAANETQVVTQVVNGVYVDENGQPITDANGDFIPASEAATTAGDKTSKAKDDKQSSADNKQNSKSGDTSKTQSSASSKTDNQNSGAQQSAGSGNSGSGERTKTPSGAKNSATKKSTKADDSAKELTIGGKSYKVGDKVTCTYFLTVPQPMLNFQGRVEYDNTMLKKTNAYLVAPASYSAMLNATLDNRVVFNGSDLSGYDFTEPGYEFLVVEYEVLKTGTTEPAITFEVITDTNDKAYAGANGVLSGGAKVMSVYS